MFHFWDERAHSYVGSPVVNLFVYLFVYGFATFTMHEVTSHRCAEMYTHLRTLKFRDICLDNLIRLESGVSGHVFSKICVINVPTDNKR